jgi:tRNA pseudouridine55 synthase
MLFFEDAILCVDKPVTWTSFDAVKYIRRAIRGIKIGHAGTLDPLASGVLLLCTGKKTKQIDNLHALSKTYTGEIDFHFSTPSYDLETQPDAHFEVENLTLEQVQSAAQQFVGSILQLPPAHSAIKVDGERLYVAAREGLEVKLRPRAVEVESFSILSLENGIATFEVVCGKGTYIRSLAHDLGKAVGGGATLISLIRSAVGPYSVKDAWSLEALMSAIYDAKQTQKSENETQPQDVNSSDATE